MMAPNEPNSVEYAPARDTLRHNTTQGRAVHCLKPAEVYFERTRHATFPKKAAVSSQPCVQNVCRKLILDDREHLCTRSTARFLRASCFQDRTGAGYEGRLYDSTRTRKHIQEDFSTCRTLFVKSTIRFAQHETQKKHTNADKAIQGKRRIVPHGSSMKMQRWPIPNVIFGRTHGERLRTSTCSSGYLPFPRQNTRH